jgi:hypothetical protein
LKRPAFQFYPADWRTDSSLKVCTLAARGLWVEMLCLLHELGQQEGSRYGFLELRGKPLSPDQLGRLVGIDLATLGPLLEELEAAGVFSRDEGGVIYSRRLDRDGKIKQIRSNAGSKGGSKSQAKAKQTTKQNGSKTPSKATSKTQANGAHARAPAEDEVEVEEEEEEKGGPGESDTPATVVDLYHDLCPSLPRCLKLTPARKSSIKARAKEFATQGSREKGLGFALLFQKAEASDFLTGRDGNFRADLSWLINPDNSTKTLEGKYDNRTSTTAPDRSYDESFFR